MPATALLLFTSHTVKFVLNCYYLHIVQKYNYELFSLAQNIFLAQSSAVVYRREVYAFLYRKLRAAKTAKIQLIIEWLIEFDCCVY